MTARTKIDISPAKKSPEFTERNRVEQRVAVGTSGSDIVLFDELDHLYLLS